MLPNITKDKFTSVPLPQLHQRSKNRPLLIGLQENVGTNNLVDKNNVYRYFSNSKDPQNLSRAAQEHGVSVQQFDKDSNNENAREVISHQHQGTDGNIEQTCFHLYDKICSNCDGPLKRIQEFCCLRCERNLFYIYPDKSDQSYNCDGLRGSTTVRNQDKVESSEFLSQEFFICKNCECCFTFCSSCFKSRNVCLSCRRDLKVCVTCRRKLCVFCLQEVATGKDREQQHINEALEESPQVNCS